jgi:hypothetical protein
MKHIDSNNYVALPSIVPLVKVQATGWTVISTRDGWVRILLVEFIRRIGGSFGIGAGAERSFGDFKKRYTPSRFLSCWAIQGFSCLGFCGLGRG